MRTGRRLVSTLERLLRDRSCWSALAVLAAGLLLVEVNVLAARSFTRWDFSTGARFSPSAASKQLLRGLDSPVEVIVLLPTAHPLRAEVRHLLDAFASQSPQLEVRYVDPDRDAAEYLALAKEREGAAQNPTDPGSLPEAALLVRQAGRRWFVPMAELYQADGDGGRRPRIEAAISEALARVQSSERLFVCFVTGHGEKSLDDGADDGLLELGRTLEAKNLEARRAPLDVTRPDRALRDCNIVLVAGPKTPLPAEHEQALMAAAQAGAHFLLFLDPIVDARGNLESSGLERLSRHFGVELPRGFVLEREPEQRLPQGIGEAFLAEVAPHPVTSGLSSSEMRLDRRAVVVAAQPLTLAPGSVAVPLLLASPQAVVLDRLGTEPEVPAASGTNRPLIAAATRIQSAQGKEVRAIVAGTSNLVDSRSFRDPALVGNRTFAEQAVNWVSSRPLAAAISDSQPLPAGLALTEESLQDLLRYVLVYMPGTTFLLGVWVLWRRRRAEARSRLEPPLEVG